MPRARTTASEDVVVVQKPRASRARAVVSVDGESVPAPRKRAPQKTAPKKVVSASESLSEPEPAPVAQRKAPTSIASERRTKVRTTKMFVTVATFCAVLTGAGVTVGMFDHGAIDVVAVVNSRNEQISRGEVRDESGQTVTNAVPVQTDNSGLRIADPSVPTQVTPPTPIASTTTPVETIGVSTTATTTATSTESTTRDSALKPAL